MQSSMAYSAPESGSASNLMTCVLPGAALRKPGQLGSTSGCAVSAEAAGTGTGTACVTGLGAVVCARAPKAKRFFGAASA